LLLIDAVEFGRVFAKQVHDVAEVVIIGGFLGIEFDGLGIILEGFFHRPVMGVHAGQVVVGGRVFGVQFQGLFPLFLRAILVLQVVEERTIRQPRAGVVGMFFEKILVGQADGLKALVNPAVHLGSGQPGAFGGEIVVFLDPFVDLGLGRIVVGEQFLII